MSYEEYLEKTGQVDTRTSWKWWKIQVCGMSVKEAIRASITVYEPIKKVEQYEDKDVDLY